MLAAVVAAQGCGSDAASVNTPPAGFTISVDASASVLAGHTVVKPIAIARSGGFANAITYTSTGVPAGLTVTATNSAKPDSAALTIVAATTLAAGNYPITLIANASGADAQQKTIAVTVSPPPPVGASTIFKSVIVGDEMSCALNGVGVAYCWGLNSNGQLGNGTTSAINATPIIVGGGFTFENLTLPAIGHFACGVVTGGAAYCWGRNDIGQLGDGTMTQRLLPTPVAGGLKFLSLSAGEHHICGVTLDFAAYCWGLDNIGILGDGSDGIRMTPVRAILGMTFKSVMAASDYTCGLTPAGAAYCWGAGGFGQLGNGRTANSSTAVPVSGGLTFSALAVGGLDACGLTTAGAVYCWGHNFYGEVGDGTTTLRSSPVPVTGGLTFTTIAAGFEHFCAVATGGAAYCWGYNETAVVGDGTFTHRSDPTLVVGGFTFMTIAVGNGHACAATNPQGDVNELYCWGANGAGELGDGTTAPAAGPFKVFFAAAAATPP